MIREREVLSDPDWDWLLGNAVGHEKSLDHHACIDRIRRLKKLREEALAIKTIAGLPTVCFGGYGRAGKDTAGKFLGQVSPLRYIGSTSWVGKSVVARRLGLCEQEAWETRHARREEWRAILDEYRVNDPPRLIRDSLAQGEIVVGVRAKVELLTAKSQGLLTHIVWVDNPRVPVDPTTEYRPGDCDFVISNDSTIEEFHGKLLDWFKSAKIPLLPS